MKIDTFFTSSIFLFVAVLFFGTGCDEKTKSGENTQGFRITALPERSEDLVGMINEALLAGAPELVVPPGRYRVSPQNREHLRFEGVENFTLIADGVEMICTETTRAVTIENCKNLTILGLTIDYDPLPYTQGRIVSISPDTSVLEVEIIEGYSEPGEGVGSVEIFNPKTMQLRGRKTHYSTKNEPAGPMRVRLVKPNADPALAIEQIGDIAVIRVTHAPGGSIPHAIFTRNSEGLVFENVTLYAANTFGFLENSCSGSRYLGCAVARRPPEMDLHARAIPRLRSTNADAFHSKNAPVGPRYENCRAHFMGDDAIAINGDFHFISRVEGDTLRVLAKGEMRMLPGDPVQIFDYEGNRISGLNIISLEEDGERTEEETAVLASKDMNANIRERNLLQAWRVRLSGAVDVSTGAVICSENRIGNGFAIVGCDLGMSRARGILVKAGHGEIRENTIRGTVLSAILVSPEFWWMEAGLADNLRIVSNTLTDIKGMGIAVIAVGGNGSISPAGAFRNIEVRDNIVRGGPSPGLLLTSIAGLIEEGNTIEPSPDLRLHPWETNRFASEPIAPVMRINIDDSQK